MNDTTHTHFLRFGVNHVSPVNLATYGMARLIQPDTPILLSKSLFAVRYCLSGRFPLDILIVTQTEKRLKNFWWFVFPWFGSLPFRPW